MSLEEHLKNNRKYLLIHWPSIFYGFIIGAVIATSIMFANRPMTFAKQLGCKESMTIDVIKGHTIAGCSEEKKK